MPTHPAYVPNPSALPFALAAAGAQVWVETARASIEAWSALARGCGAASEGYARLAAQALNVEAAAGAALAQAADAALASEIAASEVAAEDLVHVAEEVLAETVGRAPPLPE